MEKIKVLFDSNKYLRKILVLYESGSILNETSKKIKDEISKTMDSFVVYQSVKNNIPETYLTNKKENKKTEDEKREIILSEMLIN